jgi:uncharacterized protein YbjQ (UPF0145 family)
MWNCPKCGERHEDSFEICWNCGTAQDGTEDPGFERAEAEGVHAVETTEVGPAGFSDPADRGASERMVVTTTPGVEGRRIIRYCGLVAGETILQPNSFRHFLASLADIGGERSTARESELRTARQLALNQMEQAALELGANAIVGVDLDYQTVGEHGAMLMVSVSGTAVLVE